MWLWFGSSFPQFSTLGHVLIIHIIKVSFVSFVIVKNLLLTSKFVHCFWINAISWSRHKNILIQILWICIMSSRQMTSKKVFSLWHFVWHYDIILIDIWHSHFSSQNSWQLAFLSKLAGKIALLLNQVICFLNF